MSVRVQTTLFAVGVVAVALGIGGAVALLWSLDDSLTDSVRASARARAEELAGFVRSGADLVGVGVDDDVLVQLIGPDGEVVFGAPLLGDAGPMADLAPGESAEVHLSVDDDPYMVVAADGGEYVVLFARTLDTAIEPVHEVRRSLVVGFPVLIGVVALTAWWLVGRSLERVAQAQAVQRRFVSDASHELRSPVATIRQHAEVAIAHPDRVTVAALAETVLAEDLRLQRLVEDLLVLARADEHTLEVRRRPVDVDDLVFDEARRLRETTPLRVDTTAVSAGRVDGDALALRRVLRNLVDNAGRHARERVALGLAADAGRVVLSVDDDGPGIPADQRERVFERFVRLDDARSRDAGGGGLGLAIVAELVRAHGGTVTIADSPLGGARIEVRLPTQNRSRDDSSTDL